MVLYSTVSLCLKKTYRVLVNFDTYIVSTVFIRGAYERNNKTNDRVLQDYEIRL